jgi:metal-dependent amidase/aminoacylase/carboxypeptidase family protein
MLDARVFDGIDVCLSSHPSSEGTSGATEWPLEASASLAMVGYRYEFSGVAAHAAASPHLGVNALSAVIALFNGIDSMRQHFTEDVRIHGIITDGGDAPNVVPSYAAANFMLRAHDGAYLENVVSERVRAIADGAARMSGATLEISPIYPFYDNVRPSAHLARRSVEHAKTIGIDLDGQTAGTAISASTDFGNVSQAIPSFAFRFGVSPDFVALHTAEMTKLGDSEYAHKSAVSTAKVLAATAHDLLSDDQFFEDVVGEFAERGKALGRVM